MFKDTYFFKVKYNRLFDLAYWTVQMDIPDFSPDSPMSGTGNVFPGDFINKLNGHNHVTMCTNVMIH